MFAYASFRFRFMRYSMRSLRSEKTVPNRMNRIKEIHNLKETLYLIFDYPYKYYTFKLFEV